MPNSFFFVIRAGVGSGISCLSNAVLASETPRFLIPQERRGNLTTHSSGLVAKYASPRRRQICALNRLLNDLETQLEHQIPTQLQTALQ